MKLALYQVDAFTRMRFGGNPAAVVPLKDWLEDSVMQDIALENNLSETAFLVKERAGYHIRWFTPTDEVDLCGHATLASAFVVFEILDPGVNKVLFKSRSGELVVDKQDELIRLDFPAREPKPLANPPTELLAVFPLAPQEVLFDKTMVVVFETEAQVRDMQPDIRAMSRIKTHGVAITAPGDSVDFVSRFFAPDVGVDEDPVTGYAHTLLTPYWARRLGKNKLHALQVSKRGGEIFCENLKDRVALSGYAVLYLKGEIEI